ncbi:MAG: hypothetical protein QM765_40130 [Myxococcales bacterium]
MTVGTASGVESTRKLCAGASALRLPAASSAATVQVWLPSASALGGV